MIVPSTTRDITVTLTLERCPEAAKLTCSVDCEAKKKQGQLGLSHGHQYTRFCSLALLVRKV